MGLEQVREGRVPFTEEPLSSVRRTTAKMRSKAKALNVCVCLVCLGLIYYITTIYYNTILM